MSSSTTSSEGLPRQGEQLDHLWSTGHCHSNVTGLPFLAEDGMLFCMREAEYGVLPCDLFWQKKAQKACSERAEEGTHSDERHAAVVDVQSQDKA